MKLTAPNLALVRNLGGKVVKAGGPRMAKLAFKAKKNAPVLCLVGGIMLIGGGTALACKKTLGVDDELSEHMDAINMNKEAIQDPGNESDIPEIKSIIRKEWINTGFDLGKRYILPVTMIAGGCTMMVVARNIEHGRFLTAMASAEAINVAFEAYRSRVIEEHGAAADKRYMEGSYDAQADFYTEQEDKRKKPKKDTIDVVGQKKPGSPYSAIFSKETSSAWSPDRADNNYLFDCTSVYLNQRLNERGYLFLSEAYDALGLPYDPIGRVAGWIMHPESEDGLGDNAVHILVQERYLEEEIERSRIEHTNPCPVCVLDFNVDGIIWDKI